MYRTIFRSLSFSLKLLVLLPTLGLSNVQADDNLIPNPGLEDGNTSWSVFVPAESTDKGCDFVISNANPHSGKACAEMKSANFARYSIGTKGLQGGTLRPGDRCRLSFWIRAEPATRAKGTPAFIVRMFLLDELGHSTASNQAVFVGLNGNATVQSPTVGLDLSMVAGELPTKWNKVECVFAVPTEFNAARLGKPEFFAQYTEGSIFLDDVSLEQVAENIPLSQVIAKP